MTTSATSQPAASAARRAAPPESSRDTAMTASRADLARGVALDPVRGAQQVLVSAGQPRIAGRLQLLDQLPPELGGTPRMSAARRAPRCAIGLAPFRSTPALAHAEPTSTRSASSVPTRCRHRQQPEPVAEQEGEAVDEEHQAREQQVAEPAADSRRASASAHRSRPHRACGRAATPWRNPTRTRPVTTAAAALTTVATRPAPGPGDRGRELREEGSDDRAAQRECRQRPDGDRQRHRPDDARQPRRRRGHGDQAEADTSSGRPPGSAASGSTSRGTMTSVMARRAR